MFSVNIALLVLSLCAFTGIGASLGMLRRYAGDMSLLQLVGSMRGSFAYMWGDAADMLLEAEGLASARKEYAHLQADLLRSSTMLQAKISSLFTQVSDKGRTFGAWYEMVHEGTPYDVYSYGGADERFARVRVLGSVVSCASDIFVRIGRLAFASPEELLVLPQFYETILTIYANGINVLNSFTHVMLAFEVVVNDTLRSAVTLNGAILGVCLFVLVLVAVFVIRPAFNRVYSDRVDGVALFTDLPRTLIKRQRRFYHDLLMEHDDLASSSDNEDDDDDDDESHGNAHAGLMSRLHSDTLSRSRSS